MIFASLPHIKPLETDCQRAECGVGDSEGIPSGYKHRRVLRRDALLCRCAAPDLEFKACGDSYVGLVLAFVFVIVDLRTIGYAYI